LAGEVILLLVSPKNLCYIHPDNFVFSILIIPMAGDTHIFLNMGEEDIGSQNKSKSQLYQLWGYEQFSSISSWKKRCLWTV
jgi:hypothetical protein